MDPTALHDAMLLQHRALQLQQDSLVMLTIYILLCYFFYFSMRFGLQIALYVVK